MLLSTSTSLRLTGCVCLSPPREDRLCPLAAEDDAMAAVKWPEPRRQAGALWGSPAAAWSDHTEEPGRRGQVCSVPMWLTDEEAKDGDSSVSSGRLSGSSGGHESCTPPHRTWTERAPQVPRPPRQPREQPPAGAAEGQDPGPGPAAGQLRLAGHLDTLQRLIPLQSPRTSAPEEGPKAVKPPASPGLPRSVGQLSPGTGRKRGESDEIGPMQAGPRLGWWPPGRLGQCAPQPWRVSEPGKLSGDRALPGLRVSWV